MTRTAAGLFLALALAFARVAYAADAAGDMTDADAMRKYSDQDKRTLVASTLKLTSAEDKKFWRIYDTYQRDLDESGRMRARALEVLVARDRPLSEKYAVQLARDLVLADKIEYDSRAKMQRAVLRALPPRKAVRYLQIESKLRAVQMYDIATHFPLLQ